MNALIKQHLDEVQELCRRYRVKRLYLIGSALGEQFNPETSDIDFVVEFHSDAPGKGFGHAYFQLSQALESLFERDVDLIDVGAIDNRIFRRIYEQSREPLYAA